MARVLFILPSNIVQQVADLLVAEDKGNLTKPYEFFLLTSHSF